MANTIRTAIAVTTIAKMELPFLLVDMASGGNSSSADGVEEAKEGADSISGTGSGGTVVCCRAGFISSVFVTAGPATMTPPAISP